MEAAHPGAAYREDDWFSVAAQTAHVAVGVSRLDDGCIVEVNDAFCRLFGYARADILGRRSTDLGLWLDPAQRDRLLELLRQRGHVTGYEARYRHRSGEHGHVEVSATFVSRGGQMHLVSFLSEVTDRHELVDNLRQTQARLGLALRATGLLVFRQDRELRYTWVVNPALGAQADDIVGRTDAELLGPEAAAPLTEVKRRVLDTGRAERRDVWVANNGQLACFDLVAEPDFDGAGRVCGVICAALDITQRMTAPRPQPAAATAHRGPLRAIEGLRSLIGREQLSPRQVERLERIGQATRRLEADRTPAGADTFRRLCERHAGRRVLVAEHNPVLRVALTALLEAAGLRVAQASNGVEAFSRAVELAPALLLLDMELPQRGGVAAARAVRTMLRHRLPIIAMVSPAPRAGAAAALDADLDDVLDKPVEVDLLYRKVLAWLELE